MTISDEDRQIMIKRHSGQVIYLPTHLVSTG
jgi:hypothetical protein